MRPVFIYLFNPSNSQSRLATLNYRTRFRFWLQTYSFRHFHAYQFKIYIRVNIVLVFVHNHLYCTEHTVWHASLYCAPWKLVYIYTWDESINAHKKQSTNKNKRLNIFWFMSLSLLCSTSLWVQHEVPCLSKQPSTGCAGCSYPSNSQKSQRLVLF